MTRADADLTHSDGDVQAKDSHRTYCYHCGSDTPSHNPAKPHWLDCPKHPAHAALAVEKARADEARKQKDAAYGERNQCVALIVRMALALGWRAGVGAHIDKPGEQWEDDWRTLVSVDLPTGQASWHFHDSEMDLLAGMPAYTSPWDGHDTPEKYRRVRALLAKHKP